MTMKFCYSDYAVTGGLWQVGDGAFVQAWLPRWLQWMMPVLLIAVALCIMMVVLVVIILIPVQVQPLVHLSVQFLSFSLNQTNLICMLCSRVFIVLAVNGCGGTSLFWCCHPLCCDNDDSSECAIM